jgi:hypothetical protein
LGMPYGKIESIMMIIVGLLSTLRRKEGDGGSGSPMAFVSSRERRSKNF